MKYAFILNKSYHEWANPFISVKELKKLGKLNGEQLYLKIQGIDEPLSDAAPVDLARHGIEQIYSKAKEKYQFVVNGQLFVSPEPFITETELRAVGKIPPDDELYFKVEGKDRKLKKGEKIDLKPYPIEEFCSVAAVKLVKIKINGDFYEVKRGTYSVAQIRALGSVEGHHVLGQVINGQLVDLAADAVVEIKGGEVFSSYPPAGCSS